MPAKQPLAGVSPPRLALALAGLASLAYFYRPLDMPPGYYDDALSNVVNALYIHLFGRDEYGVAYPLAGFRSFGDYKPPLFMYIISLLLNFCAPSLALARLVGLIAGWLGVAVTVLVARRLVGRGLWAWTWAPLGGLMLLSSWVLVPQRISMEMTLVVLAVALLLAATLALLEDPASLAAGLALGLAWGLLPYVYHSTRFLYLAQGPLLVAALLWGRGAWRGGQARGLYLAVGLAALLGAPMLWDLLGNRTSLARFQAVRSHNLLLSFVENYLRHLGPDFLFLSGDANPRHHSGYLGMLNLAFLPLLPMGLLALLGRVRERGGPHLYVLLLLAAGLVPVSLTNEGLPHALRTLNLIPPLLLLAFLGADKWWEALGRTGLRRAGAVMALGLLLLGGWLAAQNLNHYLANPLAHKAWSYFGPQPGWRENDSLHAPRDHSSRSMPYRYYRIVEMGDYRFRE